MANLAVTAVCDLGFDLFGGEAVADDLDGGHVFGDLLGAQLLQPAPLFSVDLVGHLGEQRTGRAGHAELGGVEVRHDPHVEHGHPRLGGFGELDREAQRAA